ncbi:MAG: hypothetical protein JJV94_07455 [Sulfurospirillum sp.]|nr:hypothetical protein [Sulfurospirillum sp.]
MQYINEITINNFKFFKNETIEIGDNKNILMYGENGSGKSSLYFALKYGVYQKLLEEEQFKNTNFQDNLNVSLGIEINSHRNCYFLNYKNLEKIIENNNLFDDIEDHFSFEFHHLFESILGKSNNLKEFILENATIKEIQVLKDNINKELRDIFNQIELEANPILLKFEETFQITFNIEDLKLNVGNRGLEPFEKPKISIQNSKNKNMDLHVNLNEAKAKTLSLAIYFALIKINSQNAHDEDFKLLVLDDFLLSFDMGNRSFVMKYIFEEFSHFQKIILTHNLLFYNLVKKIYTSQDETTQWEEMKLFPRLNNDGISEAKVYLQNTNYLDIAKKDIKKDNPDLEKISNNLRKSLEKILYEITIFLEIGSIKLNDILKNIRRNNNYEINGKSLNIEKLNKILRDSQFYKDIVLNSASHNNEEDLYKKELEATLANINNLSVIFKDVKNGNS